MNTSAIHSHTKEDEEENTMRYIYVAPCYILLLCSVPFNFLDKGKKWKMFRTLNFLGIKKIIIMDQFEETFSFPFLCTMVIKTTQHYYV